MTSGIDERGIADRELLGPIRGYKNYCKLLMYRPYRCSLYPPMSGCGPNVLFFRVADG